MNKEDHFKENTNYLYNCRIRISWQHLILESRLGYLLLLENFVLFDASSN